MNSLSAQQNENYPGMDKFWFAPVDYISSIGDAEAYIINSIVFNGAYAWLEGYSLPGVLQLEEVPKDNTHGVIYNCSLSGRLAGDDAVLVAQLIEMKQYRFVIAAKDNNGKLKLMGSLDIPCLFEFKLIKSNNANHYDFNFYCVKVNDPLYFLSAL